MANSPVRVLLVEDGPGYAQLLRKTLAEETNPAFHVDEANRVQTALKRLAQGGIDVVLLDLYLPDSNGLETFATLRANAPDVPVVVLTVVDNDAVAVEAVRQGAQDFLVKGQVDGKTLSRVMRYAIERHLMQQALRSLALLDELTGLYNRRGFLNLAEHHLNLAKRTSRGSLIVFADLDGLKQINDAHGHHEGDAALIKTADILRMTFRTSDILARIGGDEFAVIATQADKDSPQVLTQRLHDNLQEHNAQAETRYPLSLSAGVLYFEPSTTLSIQALMEQADAALYEDKRRKKAAR